jgi:arylsulfatase A-like enzyme
MRGPLAWPVVVLFPVALVLGLPGCGRRQPPVVLISIDTLRPDHLGCYGYARPTSPNLDAFRKDAILFTNAFAHASSTLASHAAILTSQLPPHHGGSATSEFAVSRDVRTLAETMREDGYATASFNGGIQLDAAYGLDRGFDVYLSVKLRDASAETLVDEDDRFAHEVEQGRVWVEKQQQPFFLFLHTYEVHHPYTPEESDLEPFRGGYRGPLPDHVTVQLLNEFNGGKRTLEPRDRQHIVDTYDGEIRSTDRAFGTLVTRLKALGLYDSALVVVTSDHGEEFGEHGAMGWHAHTLYDELLHVPLLVKLPGGLRAGDTDDRTVRGIDIAPTMLTALGQTVPSDFEGGDVLAPGPRPPETAEVFSSLDTTVPSGVFALRTPEWKLVDHRLYDLRRDPGELHDVAASRSEVVARLTSRRRALLESRPRPRPQPARIDEGLRRRLHSLGYLD